jgi:hypothetical protein
MRSGIACTLVVFGCLVVWPVSDVRADDVETDLSKEPMFVRWLVAGNPGDETIRVYWERAKRDELSAEELVDLGTMLFERGYPKDAVRMYRAALDLDKRLYEAWFRIGLVLHREGDLDEARRAYKKCLKLLVGHGWCNFYLGLLEEQTNHPSRALDHYRRAYKVAPELADPEVNPEVLHSKLQFGAAVRQHERERFADDMPMHYLDPRGVYAVRRQFEPTPTPTPTATPSSTPRPRRTLRQTPIPRGATGAPAEAGAEDPTGATATGTAGEKNGRVRPRPPRPRVTATPGAAPTGTKPYGVRRRSETGGATAPGVGPTSPEASLRPLWGKPQEWLLALL